MKVRGLNQGLLYLGVAFFLSACGGGGLSTMGATSLEQAVQTSDYPMVVMVVLPGGAGVCTGTFISSNAVLTAAHCTQRAGTYTIFSSFGSYTTSNKTNLSAGVLDDPHDLSVLVFSSHIADWEDGQIAYLGETPDVGDQVTIVGFGCKDLDTRLGTGVKRMGQNVLASVDDYLEIDTPLSMVHKNILGPLNRAGSCFGDSGGPMFKQVGDAYQIIGVTHAGGTDSTQIISQYINLDLSANQSFLDDMAAAHTLDTKSICEYRNDCGAHAMAGISDIFKYFKFFIFKIYHLLF